MPYLQPRDGGFLAPTRAQFQFAVGRYRISSLGDTIWGRGSSRLLSSEGVCVQGEIKALSIPPGEQHGVLTRVSKCF